MKNKYGTLELSEQLIEQRYKQELMKKEYLFRIGMESHGRRKRLLLAYETDVWEIDKIDIMIKGEKTITAIYGIEQLEEYEELDIIMPNERVAYLRIQKGEEEFYLSSLQKDMLFSIYVGCQYDKIVAWFSKVCSSQKEIFITLHGNAEVGSEIELRRFSEIAQEAIRGEKLHE